MASRRDVFKNLLRTTALASGGGMVWGTVAQSTAAATPFALRPPGALNSDQFMKACIKCGQCVEACPYDTLQLATPSEDVGVGTPYFKPRQTPCYLCTNHPCTTACPSGALDIKTLSNKEGTTDINKATMGLAVIHRETCIAYWGIQCDACYRSCPLIDEAIVLQKVQNEVTGKHANLQPVVNSDVCTGCGLCENVCVVEKAAIKVLPLAIATGEVGDHYIKGWDKEDEGRMREKVRDKEEDKRDIDSALDYLNNDDDLFD